MKKTLTAIAILTALLSDASAQKNHLEIKVPDLVASGFFGPIKKVVTEYSYNMSDRKYKEVHLYDEAGNLQSRTKWNLKGEITYFATNTFNEAGCFINQRVEDVREKTTNDYEIVLNVPSRKIAYSDKITGEVEILTYNESKYLMSATLKKKEKKTMPLSSYKRGPENQKRLYTRHNDKGRVKYTTAYEWNDGQLISRTLYTNKEKNSKNLILYEYPSIDKYGNWTQCLKQSLDLKKNKEKEYEKISIRTLEYFEDTLTEATP